MADDVIFEKEDRVKIISGKLKGNKGYVRYVGTVKNSKENVIYVGVELDEPRGKHDGRVKGKRYFKCRDKHGYMAPHESFELFGKSKKKLLNRKLTRLPKLRSTKSTASTPTPPVSLKNAKSSKSRSLVNTKSEPHKKRKKKRESQSIANATDDVMDRLEISLNPTDLMNVNVNVSPSPTPIVTQITYSDKEIQTEMAFSVVNDDNDIATVSKQVAEGYQSMIQSLRGEITKLNTEITDLKQKNLKFENNILSKNDVIEKMSIEGEAMTEEIDCLTQSIDEGEILIANMELDIDDLQDERDRIRSEFYCELSSGQQDINEILQKNQVLKETLDTFRKTVLKEIADKNKEIMHLSLKCRTIPSLQQHIHQLEQELIQKQHVENELIEFKREIDLRSDSDRIIEILSTTNVELEYEIKRLNEVNKHLAKMDDIYHEIEQENEEYIFDLNEDLKRKDTESRDIKCKHDKLEKELRHSQNTVFQFKDHIRKLEDTKRRMMVSTSTAITSKKEEQLQREMLLRSNLELMNKIETNKNELINYTKIAAKGFSHSLENIILKQHIPSNVNIDYGAMQCLSFLQRISFKVRFCKEVLDLFYISDANAMGGDIAMSCHDYTANDLRDIYKVLELCPILVKHDRFIEAIQRALTSSYLDKFNESLTHWAALKDAEDKYDALLSAVQANDICGKINISEIHRCNDLFRSFIQKHFMEFNPEQKLRSKEKIDKWALYEVIQQLKYSLYLMQFRMREINDMIAKLSGNNDHNDDDDDDEDDDLLMNGSFTNKPSKPQQRQLLFGVLQKMEELQSHLTQIVRRSLKYCAPSRCMFFGTKTNLDLLKDENYIGIEFDFVERTAHLMRTLITKQNVLYDSLNNMNRNDVELSHFDRIGKINRLLDEESESSSCGLVTCLETLYKHLKSIPYALEQLYATRVSSIVEVDCDGIVMGDIEGDKLYCMHMELERELRKEREKKERALIRTAESDNCNDIELPLTPWMKKATLIRNELEKADIIRDALYSAQAEIKYKHKELLLEKSNTQQIKARLQVVGLELAKQHSINRNLVHFELQAKESESKLMKYVDTNKELKSERDKLLKKGHELEGKLTSYQNTLKSMKLASNRKKIKNLHDDEDVTPRHDHTTSVNVMKHMHPHRRGSSLTLGFKNGKLGLGEAANSFDAMDRVGNDERVMMNQLRKQLDLSKDYNRLLEKTINSLRHSHHIYDLNRQWMEIKRDLKVLPSFNSIEYCEKNGKTKGRKGKDNSKECIYLSSLQQKERKKEEYVSVRQVLRDLDVKFGAIYSAPSIVDLEKHENIKNNRIYQQELIGRNLKLRELKLECVRLSKETKEIGAHFCNDSSQTRLRRDNDEKTNLNLTLLGRIDIEGMKNNNGIQKTNVCLNRNNVTKLHNYLNVIC